MLRDVRGTPLSTRSAEALAACEEATDLFARYSGKAFEVVEAALARDPGLVTAHCIAAAIAVTSTERGLDPVLRRSVLAGEALATAANERERMHLAAAQAWLEGEYDLAMRRYARIAVEHPRDLVALQVTHIGDYMLGRQTSLRDHVAQALHAWDPQVPGYGYVLGMYAFGLEETGDYARAEEAGRRAVERDARDAWASHAVAHVMEMQGRIGEGMRWLRETSAGWEPENGLAFHNWWHLALYHIDAGDVDGALALYDERIRPGRSDVALELVDAAALLWRLHLRGHDLGRRARELAEDWARRIDDAYHVFNDVHALLAFLAAGRAEEAARLLASVERHASDAGTNGRMIREAGLPVCRALLAFSRGEHEVCAEELLAVRDRALAFGGSNAQRDVLSVTALEAAERGGLAPLARALASERTRLRPTNPAGWVATARILERAGDAAGAAWARAQAGRLSERLSAGAPARVA